MVGVEYEVSDGIATITLNRPASLNALTPEDYDALGEYLREADRDDKVIVTMLQGVGRFFCAGTDVNASSSRNRTKSFNSERNAFLNAVARTNLDINRALYNHRKILIAALNGPAMGIAAAYLGNFDFIYGTPNSWLSTPFSFLGISSEGVASSMYLERMGPARAKEALLFGKKLSAQELLQCGFINKIFDCTPDEFSGVVRAHILSELKDLDPVAMLASKALMAAASAVRSNPDAANMRESYTQAQRFASGIPAERFARIARKELRHKL